jgi:hypothetical protein
MRWVGIAAITLLLAGCASSWSTLPPRMDRLTSYSLGEPQTVSVGEPIVAVGNINVEPAYRVTDRYVPPRAGGGDAAALEPGMVLRAHATDAAGRVLLHRVDPSTTIVLNADGLIESWGFGANHRSFKPSNRPETPIFVPHELPIGEGSFKAEIIYSGMDGQTVRATYREFVDDMARAAFFQDLNFNLAESRIVGYRSLRIEILEATNSAITFRVLEDGGLPWLPRR